MARWIGIILYAAACLLAASCAASHVRNAPIDCTDGHGHGPDRGTQECNYAIMQAQAQRPAEVRATFLGVVGAGAVLLLLWCIGKALQRRGYFIDNAQEGPPRD